MVLDRTRFSIILFGMEKVMRLAAKWYPEFQKRLAEKNLVVQFGLRDAAQGRAFLFQDGKVTSKPGLHPKPDVVLSFKDAPIGATFLSPMKVQMDFHGAIAASQLEAQGAGGDVDWLCGTLNMMLRLSADSHEHGGPDGRRACSVPPSCPPREIMAKSGHPAYGVEVFQWS